MSVFSLSRLLFELQRPCTLLSPTRLCEIEACVVVSLLLIAACAVVEFVHAMRDGDPEREEKR